MKTRHDRLAKEMKAVARKKKVIIFMILKTFSFAVSVFLFKWKLYKGISEKGIVSIRGISKGKLTGVGDRILAWNVEVDANKKG